MNGTRNSFVKMLPKKKVVFLTLILCLQLALGALRFKRNEDNHSTLASETTAESQSHVADQDTHEAHDAHAEEAHAEGDHGGHGHHGYQVFHQDFARVQVPFIIALWIFISAVLKIGFHMTPKLHHFIPESCLLIVIGLIIGAILYESTGHEPPATLTPTVFFLFLLPPIILDAGYFMPNRLFFDHLGTILIMAVIGTIWNAMTIGFSLYGCGIAGVFGDRDLNILETLLFSSLISAVDPVAVLAVFEEIHVDEILYIVVFGESLLNDAVTVVLYQMFESYAEIGTENIVFTDIMKGFASFLLVALGGTIIGIIWGYVTSLVTRFTRHATMLEPLLIFAMAYMSYLNAEIFHLSGILAITFCGITMKNYVERNVATKSMTTLRYAIKMLSSSSETIIFIFLGVATVQDGIHDWDWAFVVLTILFCSVFRSLGVMMLSFLVNQKRIHKLGKTDQVVMSYGGLRGAVAFALALVINPKVVKNSKLFLTTTVAMVYWTVFVQGMTIKPLVKWLKVRTASQKETSMNERIIGRFADHIKAGFESLMGEVGNIRIRDVYKSIDDRFIKPVVLRENRYKDPKIVETLDHLTELEAVDFLKKNPNQFKGLVGNKTMLDLTKMAEDHHDDKEENNHVSFNAETRLSISDMKRVESLPKIRNVDLNELTYHPSTADLTERKMHHLLADNLIPHNRPRRLSFSRHSISATDVLISPEEEFKVHLKVKKMVENKRKRRNRKKTANGHVGGDPEARRSSTEIPRMASTGPFERVRGSAKQLADEVMLTKVDEEQYQTTDDDERGGIQFGNEGTDSDEELHSRMPWMFNEGEDNNAFVADEDNEADNEDEAVQAKVLPWKKD